jgi:hypothetical protein
VRDGERERESREALERVARESETIGSTSLGRLGRRMGDHFAAKDAIGDAESGGTDPVEIWGRRIGRVLSLIGVMVLAYLVGGQLRLW